MSLFTRVSAIKSIQASAMVRKGLDEEVRSLALICASHGLVERIKKLRSKSSGPQG
jgi:L-asparaginase II